MAWRRGMAPQQRQLRWEGSTRPSRGTAAAAAQRFCAPGMRPRSSTGETDLRPAAASRDWCLPCKLRCAHLLRVAGGGGAQVVQVSAVPAVECESESTEMGLAMQHGHQSPWHAEPSVAASACLHGARHGSCSLYRCRAAAGLPGWPALGFGSTHCATTAAALSTRKPAALVSAGGRELWQNGGGCSGRSERWLSKEGAAGCLARVAVEASGNSEHSRCSQHSGPSRHIMHSGHSRRSGPTVLAVARVGQQLAHALAPGTAEGLRRCTGGEGGLPPWAGWGTLARLPGAPSRGALHQQRALRLAPSWGERLQSTGLPR